jgi:flavodoxin
LKGNQVNTARNPRVLIVYFTLSRQTGRVADAMAEALTARGCEVTKAELEMTDPQWTKHLTGVPMRRPMPQIAGVLIPQRRKKTGEIRIPPDARDGDYDLIVFGSPTWWLTTNMPIRTYLKSEGAKKVMKGKPFAAASVSRRYYKGNLKDIRKLGEANGGRWIDATHFTVAGNQVMSMLSWLGFMKHGEPQNRVFGLTMPPPNLKHDFEEQARDFVDGITERAVGQPVSTVKT